MDVGTSQLLIFITVDYVTCLVRTNLVLSFEISKKEIGKCVFQFSKDSL